MRVYMAKIWFSSLGKATMVLPCRYYGPNKNKTRCSVKGRNKQKISKEKRVKKALYTNIYTNTTMSHCRKKNPEKNEIG